MRKTWPVWFLLVFACARKMEQVSTVDSSLPKDEGMPEELALEERGEQPPAEPIITDDPLFSRLEDVEETAARMLAEGASDRDAQLRACLAEEDLLPAPDVARLSADEASRLKALSTEAEGPERKEAIQGLASARKSPGLRKEALRALAKLLRRGECAPEVILAIEKSVEGVPRSELPNDLVPTLLGHAGLFHLHDARVRLAAARILGKLAEARAVPFLLRARALYDNEELAREVERALKACSRRSEESSE